MVGLVVAISVLGLCQGVKPGPPPNPAAAIEKIGEHRYRLDAIEIDTLQRTLTINGRSNDVTTLEFIANTPGGMKAYESALTLETTAVKFNAALMLIGLDPANARRTTRALDQTPPGGDPVEITVEWSRDGERIQVGADQLIYDKPAGSVLTGTTWVYTGSAFIPQVGYLADLDGVLIGFVHNPSPVIESPRGLGTRRYGDLVLNPDLRLTPGTPVRLTVKAVSRP